MKIEKVVKSPVFYLKPASRRKIIVKVLIFKALPPSNDIFYRLVLCEYMSVSEVHALGARKFWCETLSSMMYSIGHRIKLCHCAESCKSCFTPDTNLCFCSWCPNQVAVRCRRPFSDSRVEKWRGVPWNAPTSGGHNELPAQGR